MQQNYQVRFLSRPGSRGRPRAALGNGIISHAHSWGELRSDTYHTHTHWDPRESCSTLCNAPDSFSPGSSVFSSMMSVKGQKIHNALQHLCGGRKLDGIG